MILLKCLLKICQGNIPLESFTYKSYLSHYTHTDYFKYDLCNCAIHIWFLINTLLT